MEFKKYTSALQQATAIKYGKIGDADAMLIDARKCFDVVMSVRENEEKIFIRR